jgi:hypothetical protein
MLDSHGRCDQDNDDIDDDHADELYPRVECLRINAEKILTLVAHLTVRHVHKYEHYSISKH